MEKILKESENDGNHCGSEAMKSILKVETVANVDSNNVITGESGVWGRVCG